MGTKMTRFIGTLCVLLAATSTTFAKKNNDKIDDCFAFERSNPSAAQKGAFFGQISAYNKALVKTSISAMSHTCNVTLEKSSKVYSNLVNRDWLVINAEGQAAKDHRRGIMDIGSGRSYVAHHKATNTLVVVFRGTGVEGNNKKRNENIVKDLRMKHIQIPWLPKEKNLQSWKGMDAKSLKTWKTFKVHKGFGNEYEVFRKAIGNRVGAVLTKTKQAPTVYCMGFSLGAALATHCAAHLKLRFGIDPHLVVGASPRVGNKSFQKGYDKIIKNSLRLMLEKDPVVQVPGNLLKGKYEHVGHRLLPLFHDKKIGERLSKDHVLKITHSVRNAGARFLRKGFKTYHKSLVYKASLTQHLRKYSKSFKKGTLKNLANAERYASQQTAKERRETRREVREEKREDRQERRAAKKEKRADKKDKRQKSRTKKKTKRKDKKNKKRQQKDKKK